MALNLLQSVFNFGIVAVENSFEKKKLKKHACLYNKCMLTLVKKLIYLKNIYFILV